jgi:hypothetical protein
LISYFKPFFYHENKPAEQEETKKIQKTPGEKVTYFGDHDRKLYVTGFRQDSTQESMTAFFEYFAKPTSVILFLSLPNGQPHPKPYAFVTFKSV